MDLTKLVLDTILPESAITTTLMTDYILMCTSSHAIILLIMGRKHKATARD
jgi:hypothetical protein